MKKLFLLLLVVYPSLAYGQGWTNIANGQTTCVSVTPTIQNSEYATGDTICASTALSSVARAGRGFIVDSIYVADIGAEAKNIQVVLFEADPSGVGNLNAAFDPGDADLDDICLFTTVSTHYSFSDNGLSVASNLSKTCKPDAAGTGLYLVLRAAETVTYDSTSALTVTVCGYQE